MPRKARIVVPDCPHHVTQRGVRKLDTFFSDDDYALYLELLTKNCQDTGVAIWAYCLMPNHLHLILVPTSDDGLAAALGRANQNYTRRINRRYDWSGHLWQGRFHSFAMDERHLMIAARYVELNPVRARLVRRPEDWRWSSAAAHLSGRDDGVVDAAPLLARTPNWRSVLDDGISEAEAENVVRFAKLGRPQGSRPFLDRIETGLGRRIRPLKTGPKPKKPAN